MWKLVAAVTAWSLLLRVESTRYAGKRKVKESQLAAGTDADIVAVDEAVAARSVDQLPKVQRSTSQPSPDRQKLKHVTSDKHGKKRPASQPRAGRQQHVRVAASETVIKRSASQSSARRKGSSEVAGSAQEAGLNASKPGANSKKHGKSTSDEVVGEGSVSEQAIIASAIDKANKLVAQFRKDVMVDGLECKRLDAEKSNSEVYFVRNAKRNLAIFKPYLGVKEDKANATNGISLEAGALREHVAYLLDQINTKAGVPVTATEATVNCRDLKGMVGSIQEFKENSDDFNEDDLYMNSRRLGTMFNGSAGIVEAVAFFDLTVMNTDRHCGNLMFHKSDQGLQMILIDNAQILPSLKYLNYAQFEAWMNVPQLANTPSARAKNIARSALRRLDIVSGLIKDLGIGVEPVFLYRLSTHLAHTGIVDKSLSFRCLAGIMAHDTQGYGSLSLFEKWIIRLFTEEQLAEKYRVMEHAYGRYDDDEQLLGSLDEMTGADEQRLLKTWEDNVPKWMDEEDGVRQLRVCANKDS